MRVIASTQPWKLLHSGFIWHKHKVNRNSFDKKLDSYISYLDRSLNELQLLKVLCHLLLVKLREGFAKVLAVPPSLHVIVKVQGSSSGSCGEGPDLFKRNIIAKSMGACSDQFIVHSVMFPVPGFKQAERKGAEATKHLLLLHLNKFTPDLLWQA